MKKFAEGILVVSGLAHGLKLFGVDALAYLGSVSSVLPMVMYALAGISGGYVLFKLLK